MSIRIGGSIAMATAMPWPPLTRSIRQGDLAEELWVVSQCKLRDLLGMVPVGGYAVTGSIFCHFDALRLSGIWISLWLFAAMCFCKFSDPAYTEFALLNFDRPRGLSQTPDASSCPGFDRYN
jgi:hypothetical protein